MVFRRDQNASEKDSPRENSAPSIKATSAASFPKLSDQDILKLTGIPPSFAEMLKRVSVEKDIAIAIRGGSPFQRYLMPCAPKPSSVKAKTGNWGFTKGVISEDISFGKKEAKANGEWGIKERDDNKELPLGKGIVEPIVHKLSLNEILAGIDSGEYNFVSAEQGRLIVTARDAPDNTNFEFSIDLKEQAPRADKQMELKNTDSLTVNLKTSSQPSWWKEEFGNFAEKSQTYFPAQQRDIANNPAAGFSDLMVYGVITNNLGTLPITGDQDLLWLSRPLDKATGKEVKVLNTYKAEDEKELGEIRLNMAIARAEKDPANAESHLTISNDTLHGLGCITPFESEVLDDANKEFANEAAHIQGLFQHGCENRNPGIPSPLDAPMVHIWKGEMYMTQNEKELLAFVMQPGYLQNNIIDVHPKWDMQQWSAVVEQQYQLQQPIPPATFVALVEFQHQKDPAMMPADKKIQYMAHIAAQLQDLKPGQMLPPVTMQTYGAIKQEMGQDVAPRRNTLTPLEAAPQVKAQVKPRSSTSQMAGLLGKSVLQATHGKLAPMDNAPAVKEKVVKEEKVQDNSEVNDNRVSLPPITRRR
jgi:hypothetical protein